MNDFAIVTDSSCDLPAELAEELELTVLPLSFEIGGKEYLNYLDGRAMPPHDYYELLRKGEPARTAAVNVDAFVGAIEPLLKAGKDVLVPAFSSGLSNTCNAARMACEEMSAKYPERKVICVDTLCASLGQGMLIYYAVQKKREGKSIEEVRDWLEQNKLHLCHLFTVDDLMHLKRGGRIAPTVAFIGSMLNFKPIMHVDDTGKLAMISKVRGRRASLDALVDQMEKIAVSPQTQTVFISHGDAPEDAEYVASEVRRRLGVKDVIVNDVGPVLGTHAGPGTMALFFFGSHR
ncbi:DegV family protein [Thermocaproicibacter melissae]|uniref:DegV family protein n=1 Tax=Thermocaproicibacter melissae TaxID=2966552 RepID=UPI0024B173D8|nr:DegV family protein [Thermocaproicibacter melissae]WBY63852.1 DegV family protein [Thermocaproicibacter melissae]